VANDDLPLGQSPVYAKVLHPQIDDNTLPILKSMASLYSEEGMTVADSAQGPG
jgi:hypothetical protein